MQFDMTYQRFFNIFIYILALIKNFLKSFKLMTKKLFFTFLNNKTRRNVLINIFQHICQFINFNNN